MAENMWEKYREERKKNESKGPKHGKQTNQKLKPYVVLEYLLKYSDKNNTKSAYNVIGDLQSLFCHVLDPLPFSKIEV